MEIVEKHFNAIRVWIENITGTIYFWFESWHFPSLYHVCIIGALRHYSLYKCCQEGELFVLNSHIVLYTYIICIPSVIIIITMDIECIVSSLFCRMLSQSLLSSTFHLIENDSTEMFWRHVPLSYSHYDKMMTICLFSFCFRKLELLNGSFLTFLIGMYLLKMMKYYFWWSVALMFEILLLLSEWTLFDTEILSRNVLIKKFCRFLLLLLFVNNMSYVLKKRGFLKPLSHRLKL